MDEPAVKWHDRRKGWMVAPRAGAPVAPPSQPDAASPAAEPVAVIVRVPKLPCFSPAAVAALLRSSRSTVQYWMDHGKLESMRDNIGDRYIMRVELIRFVRDYLQRTCQED